MGKTSVLVDETLIESALKATHMKPQKRGYRRRSSGVAQKKNGNVLREEPDSFEIDLSLEDLKKLKADR